MGLIYEHRNWPSLTWDEATIAPLLARVRFLQGRLLGRMEALGFSLREEATLEALTSDVLKSSAIEGVALSASDVRSSIARRLGLDIGGAPRGSRDVEGIVEMMLDATRSFKKPLTHARLFGWHSLLFPSGRSGLRKITSGSYRTQKDDPMQVVSGAMGKERVHYEAPPGRLIRPEMKRFLSWFEAKDARLDPVLKAGLAHFWFVTLHPFQDGNGRIARAVSDLTLARAEGTGQRFYSVSAQIEAERSVYYRVLAMQQRSSPDVTQWLVWFLECLERGFERADTMLEEVLFKAEFWIKGNQYSLNERQRTVLNRMLQDWKGFLSSSKYAKLCKCSQDSAQRDIQDLLQYKLVVPNPSGGRSTSYRLPTRSDLLS